MVDNVLYIDVSVIEEENIEIDILEEELIEVEVSEGGSVNLPYYNGEYEITPKVKDLVLETKNKSMHSDVVVLQIPRFEFENPSKGRTVVIGGV